MKGQSILGLTLTHMQVARLGLWEPPPKLECLLDEWQLLAREDVVDEALIVEL